MVTNWIVHVLGATIVGILLEVRWSSLETTTPPELLELLTSSTKLFGPWTDGCLKNSSPIKWRFRSRMGSAEMQNEVSWKTWFSEFWIISVVDNVGVESNWNSFEIRSKFVRNSFDSIRKICDSIDSKGQKIFKKFNEN